MVAATSAPPIAVSGSAPYSVYLLILSQHLHSSPQVVAATARVVFELCPPFRRTHAKQSISIVPMADSAPPAAVSAAPQQPGEPLTTPAAEQPAAAAATAAQPEAAAASAVPSATGEASTPAAPASGDAPADATPAAGQPAQAAGAAAASPAAASAEPRLPVRAYLEQTGEVRTSTAGSPGLVASCFGSLPTA